MQFEGAKVNADSHLGGKETFRHVAVLACPTLKVRAVPLCLSLRPLLALHRCRPAAPTTARYIKFRIVFGGLGAPVSVRGLLGAVLSRQLQQFPAVLSSNPRHLEQQTEIPGPAAWCGHKTVHHKCPVFPCARRSPLNGPPDFSGEQCDCRDGPHARRPPCLHWLAPPPPAGDASQPHS